MTIGTKSVLFGAHCFFLHPFFIARAWWKLYGFPWDPRLWFAFFLHDIGYIGKPNMDGPEGETHPMLGARVLHALFDWAKEPVWYCGQCGARACPQSHSGPHRGPFMERTRRWHDFSLYHSRYYAKAAGKPFSRLCVADKLTFCVTPWWLYLPMVTFTGEIQEYFQNARLYGNGKVDYSSPRKWHASLSKYMQAWVDAHRNGEEDSQTRVRHRPAA